MMFVKQFVKGQLDKFERRWNYDTSYVRQIVDEAGVGAIGPLGALQKLGSYRRDVPLSTYFGATLTASRYADCGPCLQLGVSMAEADGISPALIRAILSNDPDLPQDVRLGVDLARATVARDSSGEAARAEILRRWGCRALVSLAYGIVATQAYPTFKYAIGAGHACVRVRVGGEQLTLKETVPA